MHIHQVHDHFNFKINLNITDELFNKKNFTLLGLIIHPYNVFTSIIGHPFLKFQNSVDFKRIEL